MYRFFKFKQLKIIKIPILLINLTILQAKLIILHNKIEQKKRGILEKK